MKVVNALGGAAVVLVSVSLTGCGGGDTTPPPPRDCPAAEEPECFIDPGQPPNPGWINNHHGRYVGIECPGNATERCDASTCCPGIEATGGKTFPCALMDSTAMEETCEVGRAGLIDALLAHMTRCEKYKFLKGTGWGFQGDDFAITPGYYIGNAAGFQRFGIPSLNMHDSGNGFNNIDITTRASQIFGVDMDVEQVTGFPVSLNLASTWSEDFAKQFGEAMGEEFKAKGANCLLGPALETHRVPYNGRNAEYLAAESPYLGARLVKPYIRAVQSKKVLASAKHFIGNHQETCRRQSDSIIDPRTRFEVYYPQFEAAIEADASMIMCGYNMVNGEWNCGSQEILNQDLRQKLGFKGWVQSDWWALHSFEDNIENAVDQEMPGTSRGGMFWLIDQEDPVRFTPENLRTLTDAQVDKKVRPQLDYMLKYGLGEADERRCQMGFCWDKLLNTTVTNDARQQLARTMATEAVVLLKNEDDTLPLGGSVNINIVAVVGSACNATVNFEDFVEWPSPSYYFIGGSGRVVPKNLVTIWDAVTEMCRDKGCTVRESLTEDVEAAKNVSDGADVVLMCSGAMSAEEMDRATLKVDHEEFLINASREINATKVVLTMTPGTVTMPWIENVSAALTVFNPGKYAGNAFADNLWGEHNPSGKSPIFYPKSEDGTGPALIKVVPDPGGDNGCSYANVIPIEYKEKLCIAWYCPGDRTNILFPFGHGLSYTTFDYTNPRITGNSAEVADRCSDQDGDKGGALYCVTVTIENTGTRPGTEIAQLYMKYPEGLGEPPKVLRGFFRLHNLPVNDPKVAAFPIYTRDLQTFSETAMDWQNHTGEYRFYISRSEADVACGDCELSQSHSALNIQV